MTDAYSILVHTVADFAILTLIAFAIAFWINFLCSEIEKEKDLYK